MRHFINLTNGIEWLPEMRAPYSFVRIQSTACEQKRWSDLICDLDYTFLIALASGEECRVYDCGARKRVARAIWQGLPFIEAACNWRWLRHQTPVLWRGHNATEYAMLSISRLSDQAKRKLDYVARVSGVRSAVILTGQSRETVLDGQHQVFSAMLRNDA